MGGSFVQTIEPGHGDRATLLGRVDPSLHQ
jgi:hypothetical protein